MAAFTARTTAEEIANAFSKEIRGKSSQVPPQIDFEIVLTVVFSPHYGCHTGNARC